MRLLNVRTGEMVHIDHPTELKYAVLSCGRTKLAGEQSYQALVAIQDEVRLAQEANQDLPPDTVLQRTTPIIRGACTYALADGVDFLWIASCCVNEADDSEVAEAILSVHQWFAQSAVCYAYLDDVDRSCHEPGLPNSQFRRSQWHIRAWTLPELLVPKSVVFLSSEWTALGTKHTLSTILEQVTGIESGVLTGAVPLHDIPIARRMSWASKRTTVRIEDEAYSLLSIFNVQMPISYGEGGLAFLRLQEEILKGAPDQSIFVWDRRCVRNGCTLEADAAEEVGHTLLAPSPAAFARSANLRALSRDAFADKLHARGASPSYLPTSQGLITSFPMLRVNPFLRLAILACADEQDRLLALVLKKAPGAITYTVGITDWDRLRGHYRPYLRAETWVGNVISDSSVNLGSAPGDSDPTFTRVVSLLHYPHTLTVSNVSVVHRPGLVSGPVSHMEYEQVQDDLFPVDRRDGRMRRALRGCLATSVDMCIFVSLFSLLSIVVLVFFILAEVVRERSSPDVLVSL